MPRRNAPAEQILTPSLESRSSDRIATSGAILLAMARKPETHYAKGPGGDIAYQVVGDGPIDLVVVPGWISHVDLLWQDPPWRAAPTNCMPSWTDFDDGIGLPGKWQLFSPSGQEDDPAGSLLAAAQSS
jgi:hypothetical protein